MDTEPYPQAVSLIKEGCFNFEFFIGVFVLLILITMSGLISGSEAAFFSLAPSDIEQIKKKKTRKTEALIKLLQKPKSLLGTILISNNLVNIAIVILGSYLTNKVFDFSNYPVVGFLVQIVGITFIILLFGEIVPKVIATNKSNLVAQNMAIPISVASVILKPFSALLVKGSTIIDRRIKQNESISADELSEAIELTSNVTTEEEDILKGIVEFTSIEASEIMVPRVDIVMVDIKTDFKSLLQIITKSGYSRIPVYNNSIDSIKGILYIKDLLPHLNKPETFGWQSMIRPPYFVPENKRVNDLLEELREKHIHMAVVVDEYGGTSGIVTLEDVIEEIIGEISDEFDELEINYTRVNDNTYLFDGKVSINDFCRVVGCDGDTFSDVNADTLAGLILNETGEMPKQYDIIKIGRFVFKIESVDSRRIKKVEVKVEQSE